jgi:hypothetical protein
VNWPRIVVGPPGKHLGRSRWPLTAVIATGGGIYAATGRLWTQAALFFGAAVVLAAMTIWSYRK